MRPSARRFYGLPPQSPVLPCTPGSQTITRAAPHWQPPHPRGLRPHRRLSSMSPARASFGLLGVSPSRYHRMGTKCLACEARFDTCSRAVALGRHIWELLPECLRQQRLWTSSLHENQGWSVVGGRGGHVS